VLNARVLCRPRPADWAWAELAVLSKRAVITHAGAARQAACPVVWDVLDYWLQPIQHDWPEAAFIAEVAALRQAAGIAGCIAATRAMAEAIGGVYVRHHCRVGLEPTPPRGPAQVVAYDGAARYLGAWAPALTKACTEAGLTFVINPPDLSTADVLVALRGEPWDGWVCRHWKSGVKYGNAIAAGRPVLTQSTAAFRELRPTGVAIESVTELPAALAEVTSPAVRLRAYRDGRARWQDFSLPYVAADYLTALHQLRKAA
jgi:hypothetical protein